MDAPAGLVRILLLLAVTTTTLGRGSFGRHGEALLLFQAFKLQIDLNTGISAQSWSSCGLQWKSCSSGGTSTAAGDWKFLRCSMLMCAIFGSLLCLSCVATGNFCGTAAGCIYPYPAHAEQGAAGKMPPSFDPSNLRMSCQPAASAGCTEIISPALQRTFERIFYRTNGTQFDSTVCVSGVTVQLRSSSSVDLQHGVNESYSLAVPEAGPSMEIIISADNAWGALRGLETLAQSIQLVPGTAHSFFNTSTPAYVLELWPPAIIADKPRTAWRGLLIDTSRHFLSIDTILRTVDAMAMAKMNLLHWHLVDGDGWPLCLQTTLDVCQKFGYKDKWGNLAAYYPADLKKVVTYARARGVRVLPEFDLPGHIAGPLCSAKPHLCTVTSSGGHCAPDPSNEKWWAYLTSVVVELGEIFPGNNRRNLTTTIPKINNCLDVHEIFDTCVLFLIFRAFLSWGCR